MKLPATDMLPRVMKLISEEWQDIWDCCTDVVLRAIKPTVGGYKRKTSLSRRDSVLINRLRIISLQIFRYYSDYQDWSYSLNTLLSVIG